MVPAQPSKEGDLPRGKLALTMDPRVYSQKLPEIKLPHKRILGLDLASSCGATFCDVVPGTLVTESLLYGGQWDLSVSKHDTNSLRYVRLKQFLYVTQPALIFYEEVKFTGQAAPPGMRRNIQALIARAVVGAQVVQGLCAVLTTWCEENDVPCEAIPIGTLKKYGTGKGNANKKDMIRSCNARFGTDFEADDYEHTGVDNIADSMFLCAMGVQHYSEGIA